MEIIDKDNLNQNIVLELDESIYNTNFKKFENQSIYITLSARYVCQFFM